MWNSAAMEEPDVGRKIVAVYADGSGASLFLVCEDGCRDAEDGEPHTENLSEYGYSSWAYLPDGTTLWFENDGAGEIAGEFCGECNGDGGWIGDAVEPKETGDAWTGVFAEKSNGDWAAGFDEAKDRAAKLVEKWATGQVDAGIAGLIRAMER